MSTTKTRRFPAFERRRAWRRSAATTGPGAPPRRSSPASAVAVTARSVTGPEATGSAPMSRPRPAAAERRPSGASAATRRDGRSGGAGSGAAPGPLDGGSGGPARTRRRRAGWTPPGIYLAPGRLRRPDRGRPRRWWGRPRRWWGRPRRWWGRPRRGCRSSAGARRRRSARPGPGRSRPDRPWARRTAPGGAGGPGPGGSRPAGRRPWPRSGLPSRRGRRWPGTAPGRPAAPRPPRRRRGWRPPPPPRRATGPGGRWPGAPANSSSADEGLGGRSPTPS